MAGEGDPKGRGRSGARTGARAGTWPPATRRARAVGLAGRRAIAAAGSARARRLRDWVARRHRARAGCCPGCRSPSASASSLYFTADREPPAVGRRWRLHGDLRSSLCVAARARPLAFPVALALAADRGRLRRRDAEDRARRASGACARRPCNVDDRGLRRGPRGARAHRPHRGPRASARRRRGSTQKLERVRVSVRKGTAPPVGSLCRRSRRGSTRRSRRCGPAATTSRATSISSASARPASCSARSRPPTPPAPPGAVAALRGRDRRACATRSTRASAPSLPGDTGAIASALITGKRDAISAPVNEAMYVSSLAHVLSISGYHMAVVAGVVFFALRALLALLPALAQPPPDQEMGRARGARSRRRSICVLSGAEVATQRAFIMTAIVLIGVMVDRPALTLRTLARRGARRAAARAGGGRASELPDVVCGDAGADRRLRARPAVDVGRAPTRRSARASRCGAAARSSALILASLVAGLATTLFAAYHFHRLAPYGVLANLLAMPIVSVWVMPAGLLASDRHAVRLRRPALAADGRGHRLDDRGRAVGREPARRGRPHAGIRRRAAAARHRRARRAVPADDRRCAGAARR